MGNAAAVTNNRVSGSGKAGVVLVAFPADYRSSGVMTFIVTKNGACTKGSRVEDRDNRKRLKSRTGFKLAHRAVRAH